MRTSTSIALSAALLLAGLSTFSSCDGGTGKSTDSDTTTVVRVDNSIPSEIVLRIDTIAKSPTTFTIVRRKLLVRGRDTSALSLDTLVYIGGEALLDTSMSGQQPCTNGMTIYNLYGTEVTMELWSGRTLEYANGRVTGARVQHRASTSSLLPDREHNRWCPGWKGPGNFSSGETDLLLLTGVPLEAGGPSFFLVQGHFPEARDSTILVLDEVGRLRTLR